MDIDSKGILSDEIIGIIQSYTPLFCVDVILIPESKSPEAVLFLRSNPNAATFGQYWVVGGRQRLGELMEKTAERKIFSETGLKLSVNPEDQLFTYDIFHHKIKGTFVPFEHNKIPRDVRGLYHTPSVCYLVRCPPYEKLKKLIKPSDGNNKFKLFTEVDSSLDPYVQKAMKEAWKRLGRI